MGAALALALSVAGASATVISLFGWRKTIKPAAHPGPVRGRPFRLLDLERGPAGRRQLLGQGMAGLLLPSWPSLFRWQVWACWPALALVPMMWLWNTPLRRLSAQRQLNVNIVGSLLGAAAMAIGGWLLLHAPSEPAAAEP